MKRQLERTWVRVMLLYVIFGGVLVAADAAFGALNDLLFHGFAVVCSDGYAELTGEPPCRPDWSGAAPDLIALALAAVTIAASIALLTVKRGRTTVDHH